MQVNLFGAIIQAVENDSNSFLLYTRINILSSENGPIIDGKRPGQNVKFLGYGRFVLGSTDI